MCEWKMPCLSYNKKVNVEEEKADGILMYYIHTIDLSKAPSKERYMQLHLMTKAAKFVAVEFYGVEARGNFSYPTEAGPGPAPWMSMKPAPWMRT